MSGECFLQEPILLPTHIPAQTLLLHTNLRAVNI
jgi:hypothetical protein